MGKKVFIAGHKGMVGSAVLRRLSIHDSFQVITADRTQVDLLNQAAVHQFISREKPDVIVVAAARVGGILANSEFPFAFLYQNLVIESNIVGAAVGVGIEQVIFLGSSCIFPKFAEQPIREDSLLTAPLEPTNQWYAVAKIAGVKMVEAVRQEKGWNWVSLMPTNLYGPNDNFDLRTSHVLPAMIRKFHEAKQAGNADVQLWGSGSPLREFMHVDDLAAAIEFVIGRETEFDLYNVGYGQDLTIKELAEKIQQLVGHSGKIKWDSSKPDGTPKKLMDSSRFFALGWRPKIDLQTGIKNTYSWFLENQDQIREVKIG